MQEKDPEITQFTSKYEKTNPLTRILLDRFYATVFSLVPGKPRSVLEIGCGAGYSTRLIHERLHPEKMHASDIDPRLVALAKEKNPAVAFSTESAYSLNQANNSYDIVFMLEVLEHLEKPLSALDEVRRVTKKYAIFSVPREPIWRILNMARGSYLGQYGNTPGHINHWSLRSFTRLISEKFKIISVRTSLPWTIILAEKNDQIS